MERDSAKVWLVRTPGVEPVVSLGYTSFDNPDRQTRWEPAHDETEFEVSADIAAAAIETGGFSERPGSKTKMKINTGGSDHADTEKL